MNISNVLNNLLAVFIILMFFLFVYASIKKQTITEVIKEFMDMIRGKQDEVVKGGLWRKH